MATGVHMDVLPSLCRTAQAHVARIAWHFPTAPDQLTMLPRGQAEILRDICVL
jgi:hypothetical protein